MVKVEDENYNPPRNAGEYCSYQDFVLSVWHRSGFFGGYYADNIYSRCASTTAFGTVADSTILQFKNDSKAYNLEISGRPVHVPNAESLFLQVGRGLHVYDNPINSFEVGKGSTLYVSYEQEYLLKPGVKPRVLKDSKGELARLDEVDASPNGEWLIADRGEGNRLLRVNPDTFEILAFPGGVGKYNPFSDPNVDMAISNDGRYAALSGGHGVTFKLYDLSTCVPDPSNNTIESTGCEPKDSWVTERYLGKQLGGRVTYVGNLQFSGDGTQLSATVGVEYPSGERAGKLITLVAPGHEYSSLEYLALGDSFSSGEGDRRGGTYYAPGTDGEFHPDEKCHLSTRSYPYLIAKQLSLLEQQFASVACSGAWSGDILDDSASYIGHFDQLDGLDQNERRAKKDSALQDFFPGHAAQIEFVKKYKPKVITVGIGGNDIGFKDKLVACITSRVTNVLASCAPATTEGTARLQDGKDIQNLYYDLVELYEDLHRASVNTKIYAVSYPNIMKTGTACPYNVPFDDNERDYAVETVDYLNTVIEAAARDAGVGYINIEDSLAGMELCTAPHETAVNGLAMGDDKFYVIGNESFHPTARGHRAMARAIQSKLPDLLNDPNYCYGTGQSYCPIGNQSPPPLSDYFTYEADSFIEAAYNHSLVKEAVQAPGRLFNATVSWFKPGSEMHWELRSEPVNLGRYTVGANGKINAQLTIPEGVPPGYHELHAIGTAPSGEPIDQYRLILVIASETDVDGDGIPNESDQCSFIQPANIDQDKDGIDDACDPFIDEPPVPKKPTVGLAEFINSSNQTDVTVSGTGEQGTVAHISIDDENPETKTVKATADVKASGYSKALDVSSLDEGAIKVTVTLTNDYGRSPAATAVATKDTRLPMTTRNVNPAPSDDGWHSNSVTINLKSSDEGTGFKQLTYSASGAQPITRTTASIAGTSVTISAEGTTTLAYFATDKAGNTEKRQTLTIRIDTAAPGTTIVQPKPPVLLGFFGGMLTGTTSDNLSGAASTKVTFVSKARKISKTFTATCAAACGSRHTSWQLAPTSLPTGRYTVTAASTDKASNTGQSSKPVRVVVVNLPWLWRW